jgi:hypothetical protein
MKIKIWPDDATVPEMDEWLAELRDEGRGEDSGGKRAEPSAAAVPLAEAPTAPVALAQPVPPAQPAFSSSAPAPAQPVTPVPRAEAIVPAAEPTAAEAAAPMAPAAPAPVIMRPLIGDQLRMPIIWCEMGSCISWHTDPEALGEGDARARALGAGWRLDAFGRMACPDCQQADPGFRNPYPVVLWDRHTALARAARAAAVRAPGR